MKVFIAAACLLVASATVSLAGGTCQSHFNQCKAIQKNGGVATVPCETRFKTCQRTKVWQNGVGKLVRVKG